MSSCLQHKALYQGLSAAWKITFPSPLHPGCSMETASALSFLTLDCCRLLRLLLLHLLLTIIITVFSVTYQTVQSSHSSSPKVSAPLSCLKKEKQEEWESLPLPFAPPVMPSLMTLFWKQLEMSRMNRRIKKPSES